MTEFREQRDLDRLVSASLNRIAYLEAALAVAEAKLRAVEAIVAKHMATRTNH